MNAIDADAESFRSRSRSALFRWTLIAGGLGVFGSAYLALYVFMTGDESAVSFTYPFERHVGHEQVESAIARFEVGVGLLVAALVALETAWSRHAHARPGARGAFVAFVVLVALATWALLSVLAPLVPIFVFRNF